VTGDGSKHREREGWTWRELKIFIAKGKAEEGGVDPGV
jgi:hypothetical protein